VIIGVQIIDMMDEDEKEVGLRSREMKRECVLVS
jgi:hypothetical protein